LLGQFVQIAGNETVGVPYLVLAIITIPLILTYAERASVITGDSLEIAEAGGILWTTYGTGWLTLGGYASLIALLGWGVALHLNMIAGVFFQASLDLPLLAAVIIGLLALNSIFGIREAWKSKGTFIFAGIFFLALLLIAGLFTTTEHVDPYQWFRNTDKVLGIATLMFSSFWGLHFVINVRDKIHRPSRTIWQALALTVVLGSGLGILADIAIYSSTAALPTSLAPLIEAESVVGLIPHDAMVILYAVFGLSITLIALSLAIVNGLQMVGAMTREGFFPAELDTSSDRFQAPVISLVLVAIASILLVTLAPIITIVGLASLALLWATVLIHIPDAISSQSKLPEKRRLRLPFHPLFPWLTVAIGLLLPFNLQHEIWFLGIGWALAGLVLYFAYARQAGLATRRQDIVVGEPAIDRREAKEEYRVMVGVGDLGSASPLIQAGIRVAQARNGRLLVLKVLITDPQQTAQQNHQTARQEWEALEGLIESMEATEVTVTPLVRLAPSPTSGILEAVGEEQVDLLLLGWKGETLPDETHPDPILDPVIRSAPCDVAVLRGALPMSISRVLVPTDGGPNIPLAMSLAQDLVEPDEGHISVEYIITGPFTHESEAQAQASLQSTLDRVKDQDAIEQRMTPARSIKAGILREASAYDLILIGASRGTFLQRSYFGGPPVEIAAESPTPVILTRSVDTAASSWSLRLWGALSDALPTISVGRRAQVYENMRQAAEPTVDFFVLITLAATIASLGLLQNSAAVIIGAMLVAPLMSPFLAMAMSLVHGDLRLLGVATEATVKGIALSIFVGAVVSIISPINSPTWEIMARTAPNLLDLLVALASGAAAGYAISRKEVAAALPGVAIAAALLPPLCVIGYGIGTSQITVATGASLLFITNLVAIVFAAGLTFLALGFHPARAERGELMRALRIAVASLAIISIILVSATASTVDKEKRRSRVEAVFNQEVIAREGQVRDMTIEQAGRGFLIKASIISFVENPLPPEALAQMQQDLTDAAGGPVTVEAAVIFASQVGLEGVDRCRQLETLLEEEMALHSAQVLVSDVEETGNNFTVKAGIIVYPEHTLTVAAIEDIEAHLGKAVDGTVTIEAIFLAGHPIGLETPTPETTPDP